MFDSRLAMFLHFSAHLAFGVVLLGSSETERIVRVTNSIGVRSSRKSDKFFYYFDEALERSR